MASVLRQLQAEWNSLVPMAQARRIPRVRMLNAPLEPIAYRREKLEWLRYQLGLSAGEQPIVRAITDSAVVVDTDLSQFTFGVEIECVLPASQSRQSIALLISQAGVATTAEEYTHQTRSYWKVVTDGSLGDYTHGIEVVSPILQGSAGFAQMNTVMRTLKSVGCKINRRCGFHVHVGVRNQPVDFFKNLVRTYRNSEEVIDSFLAPSRRGSSNGFCQPTQFTETRLNAAETVIQVGAACGQQVSVYSARNSDRYKKLNLKPFAVYGTVEFRQHQGTVEADRAENWVKLCLRMCNLAKVGAVQTARFNTTLDSFLTAVQADDSERRYFTGRVSYFASRSTRQARAA